MSYKFEEVLKKGTQRIKENINEYKNFLKVMGNNYKYDGLNQINIYVLEPNAKACAEYNFWKNNFNRVVKRGQKGIPIYSNNDKKIKYVYDITQTLSTDKEEKEIKERKLRTTKYRRAPPECVHLVRGAFGKQDTHIRINTPPIFYSPTILSTILSTRYMR